MSTMRIDRPGLLTTIQDLGRRGYQAFGVPVCGAMDTWSARLANRLVGNPDEFAVLEITMAGPRFTLERDASIAVTGADFEVRIGSAAYRAPLVSRVKNGIEVAFASRTRGARAYLAIDGGFAIQPVLGSTSTHLLARLGGFEGRALKAGDRLPLGTPRADRDVSSKMSALATMAPVKSDSLGVLPVASSDPVSAEAFATLCRESFVVAANSDRMGYRLSNTASWPVTGSSELSAPTVAGAMQLPPDGTPILLMADRQTTGGYRQIAVLQRADRPRAGQLAPGDRVSFFATTLQAAATAHATLEARLATIAPEVRV